VQIRGRVQGVFYRATCARQAEALGVSGWVRNTADGTVEAVFEGETSAVEAITRWCRTGPAGARVDEVAVTDESPEGLDGFVIAGETGWPPD
jgi:acylphosphatase